MTHIYTISGMTCGSCEAKVKSALLLIDGITAVEVSKDSQTATLSMDKHIALKELQNALDPKYQISPYNHKEILEQTKSWFQTYKPVLMIFIYLFSVTMILEINENSFDLNRWMRHFMAGFFLTFSFFKMLNLKGFKESYQMYDVLARRWPKWGYGYAFTELGLGTAFLFNWNPLVTNMVTFIVMTLSIIGVLKTVLNKESIQCACLGEVFQLPMSTVTIIEDGLMILMSLVMLMMN